MTGETQLDQLIVRAREGDPAATAAMLEAYRERLRRMVSVHFDSRLAPRIDPSDVVQETITEAAARVQSYLKSPTVPIYPWLRQLAYERLVAMSRQHIHAQKRSVMFESHCELSLPDESALRLADKIASSETTPSQRLARAEMRQQVRSSLRKLKPQDRKVLILRFLEQLSIAETAEVLGISTAAVNMRQLRALQRFKDILKAEQQNEM